MTQHNEIKIFGEQQVRSVWDDATEEWYFSVVDVVAILTDSRDPGAYWRKLKQRLNAEGSQVVTNCHGLKLPTQIRRNWTLKNKLSLSTKYQRGCCKTSKR